MIQVGDKIRFLNAQGGGIVSKIINKEMVEVTDEDGFDVPTLIRECVVVESAGQNKPQEQKIEDETFRFSQKNANICEQSCIKFVTQERLHQIAKSYTFVSYRTLTNPIMEQTNAEIIGRIDASQVIAFILGSSSDDTFGFL
mgnify:CR=1 FL=1